MTAAADAKLAPVLADDFHDGRHVLNRLGEDIAPRRERRRDAPVRVLTFLVEGLARVDYLITQAGVGEMRALDEESAKKSIGQRTVSIVHMCNWPKQTGSNRQWPTRRGRR